MSAHVSARSLLISLMEADPKDRSTDISSSSPANAAATRWVKSESDLKSIRRYREDWDGFGSPAPDPILVDAAIRFLGKLRKDGIFEPPFRVALSPNGSICIEWQSKEEYVEAEIVSEYQIEWMHAINGRTPTHTTGPLDIDDRSGVRNRTCQIAAGAVAYVSEP